VLAERKDLLPISLYIGGSCFLAEDEKDVFELLRRNAFVNLQLRKLSVGSSDYVGFSQSVAEATDPLLTLESVFWSSQNNSFSTPPYPDISG
jgi:hypothetical protein